MDIKDYRVQIDRIDKELMALLEERFDVSEAIGAYKRERGLPVLDAKREAEKIEALKAMVAPEKGKYLAEVLRAIMAESRNYQAAAGPEYGVLGRKLPHSFSPILHRDFADYNYGIIEKEPEELAAYMTGGSFKGINVTIPYKKEMAQYCDEVSEIAERAQSINTVYRDASGRLVGDNTDYFGFVYMLKREGIEVSGRKCLILGGGGVSGTVRVALEDLGAREIVVISRRGEDNYSNLDRHSDAEVIINTTPVGMFPNSGESVIDVADFPRLEGLADLIYNPLRTKLVLDCEARGIRACGGLSMLVAQGARAAEIFAGKEIGELEIEAEIHKLEMSQGNIVLIGMPGSGKTSIGRKLASALGRDFVDADLYISAREGRSASEIINADGIDEFRRIESEAVKELLSKHGIVAAMGGGVVERPENCSVLRENAIVICLDRALEDLPTEGRPVSQSDGIEAIYARRAPLYEAWSDFTVASTTIDETAQAIIDLLEV